MLADFFKLAITNISHRKLRSWLTIIGIVIGVASIVALISISQGLQNSVEEQFESFGTDIILIRAGEVSGPPTTGDTGLTIDDVKTIERINGVEKAIPFLLERGEVSKRKEEKVVSIYAYDADDVNDFLRERGIDFQDGRAFKPGESDAVVLGHRSAKELFESELQVRSRFDIEGKTFKVVGIYEEIGNEQDDNVVAIPLDTARELFDNEEGVTAIMAIAKDGIDETKLRDKIEKDLEDARNKEDIQAFTAAQVLDLISGVLGAIQLVLVGIASISLLVGAVGIMNTMYTSVLERTREIGVMKAVGATNNQIMVLFLIESGLIGLVGGVVGAGIGAGIALAVSSISANLALPFNLLIRIDPYLILFGILFAVVIGALSGLLPARTAAKLKPADALRY